MFHAAGRHSGHKSWRRSLFWSLAEGGPVNHVVLARFSTNALAKATV